MKAFLLIVFAAAFVFGFATSPSPVLSFSLARGVGMALPFTAIAWVVAALAKWRTRTDR